MPRNIRESRREQILDVALCVFAQKGFARASTRDVADVAFSLNEKAFSVRPRHFSHN